MYKFTTVLIILSTLIVSSINSSGLAQDNQYSDCCKNTSEGKKMTSTVQLKTTDVSQLREKFNEAKNKTRIIAIISPT